MIRAARRAGHAAISAMAGLAAAAVLVALAAGTPWLMWHVTGWPLPRHLPTLATLRAGIAGQESARFILALVTCAGWVIWLVFVTEVILEASWWARQLPGPAGRPGAARLRERAAAVSPPRAVATILVGGILLGLLAALRGTGAALTVPAAPRLAAVTQQAAAAPRYPASEGDRDTARLPRMSASAGNAGAAAEQAPAEAGARMARADGRMIRLDAVLLPGQDQPDGQAYTLYTVQPGDNLWDIALTHLGDGEDWHQIYALNVGRLQPDGERLVLPSLIQPGWILRLPAPAPATAPTGNGHLTSPSAPVKPGAGPAPRGASSPLPQPPVHRLSPAPLPHHPQPDAGNPVAIPWGGLIGSGLAGAIAGALTLAGIQRRRRYQPARILTSNLEPAAPLEPPVIAVLRRAGRAASAPGRSAPRGELADTEEEPWPVSRTGDGLAPGEAEALQSALRPQSLPPGVITLGLRDGAETAVNVAGLGGLGLTGPGAPAAARAILLCLLTQPAAAAAIVVVPGADANALVPGRDIQSGIATGAVPRLVVTSTMAGALDQLESAVLTRARMADTASDSEDNLSTATRENAAQLGTAALIATPDTAASGRLAAILQLSRGLGVTAILLGEWPGGVTCHVAADGYVTATGSQAAELAGMQMFHLAAGDAAAILATLQAASDLPLTGAPDGDDGVPRDRPDSAAAPPGLPDAEDRPGSRDYASGPAARPEPGEELADAAPRGSPPSPVTGARPAAAVVRVQLLGPPRITVCGSELTGGLRKARELVAYLAMHSDGATGEAVSEALWPEAPRGYGTAQRNNAVRKLREQLRSATGLDEPMFVTLVNDRYRLDAALFDIDLWRFQRALDQARRAEDGDARLAACQEAVSLYQGPLADGAGYEWAEPYAEQARRRALDACTTIAEILAPRDPEEALAILETAIDCDPYNEFIYQKVMRLQAAGGRPDAVRRTLSLLETRLSDLGVTPGPQTRSLAASLLGVPASHAAGVEPGDP